MIVSFRSRRWRMAILLVLIGVLAITYFAVRGAGRSSAKEVSGATNEERLAFINSFGWTVETQPQEEAQVVIPEQFNDVYTAYNELQLKEGFDLRDYAGKTCTHYRYAVTNYPSEENVGISVLVCEGRIIGADVASAELNGFMHGISEHPQQEETGSDQQETAEPEAAVSQTQDEAGSDS